MRGALVVIAVLFGFSAQPALASVTATYQSGSATEDVRVPVVRGESKLDHYKMHRDYLGLYLIAQRICEQTGETPANDSGYKQTIVTTADLAKYGRIRGRLKQVMSRLHLGFPPVLTDWSYVAGIVIPARDGFTIEGQNEGVACQFTQS
jgi:hypothetical protein